jgi:ubiquinone/menaquinone biosynthesis C-methylase UbiE
MMTSDKNREPQRFGRFAEGYVTSKTHAKGAELERLLEIARPQSSWVVLDIATGGGHTALKFAPLVQRIVATDISSKMLSAARNFIDRADIENVTFASAKAEAMPFDEEIFDLVTCRIAAHHFSDCTAFLRESVRLLKKGGCLLLQDLTVPEDEKSAGDVEKFESLRDPSHRRAYSPAQWVKMFENAGLQVVTKEVIAKRHEFIPWVQRQGGTEDTIRRLTAIIADAAPEVIEWMQPVDFGTTQASFVNRHIIIAGKKDGK